MISLASPFPSPSHFLNPPQSSNWLNRRHNLLRLENCMTSDPGFSLTSNSYLILPRISLCKRLKRPLVAWEGQRKPSTDAICSSLNLDSNLLQSLCESRFVEAWDIAHRCCIWVFHKDFQTLNPLVYMHLKFTAQILISLTSVLFFLK